MQIYQEIELLIKSKNLGTEIKNITKVTGGLSHRMYRVETNMGTYAVKELNPVVMKREDAYLNFVFSEQVTNIAKANNIPAIEAVKINNDIIEKVNNSYFMLFSWLDGKVLKP